MRTWLTSSVRVPALFAALLVAAPAWAAPADASSTVPASATMPPEASPAPAAAAPAAPLAAVVRGFFVGTRFGAGYMVKSATIPKEGAQIPVVAQGQPEKYGVGTMLQLEVGYDLTPEFALEVIGGTSLIGGTRTDYVRDLGLSFGGVAARLSPVIDDRLHLVIAAGAGFGRADNSIDPVESGAVVFLNAGLEYFVHVRHFSVGLDVSVLAPVSPLRVFVGVGPQVKYTF